MPSAFVIMPFDSGFQEVFDLFLRPTLESAGYEVRRADDLLTQRSILQDIVSAISQADLIVADLTSANPNVYYELGLAHALKRPVILLTQELDALPFDLRPYRVIAYDTHFSRIEEARGKLAQLATGARDGSVPFGNPFSDFSPPAVAAEGVLSPEPSPGHQPLAEEQDDRGFLDHLVDLEKSFESQTAILSEITGATTKIGEITHTFSERLSRVNAAGGGQRASQARFLFSQYASDLNTYAQSLQRLNDQYAEVALRTQNSFEFVLAYREPQSREECDELARLVEELERLEASASSARQTYSDTREVLRTMEGIERLVRRAAIQGGKEIERLVDNITITLSSIRRGVEVGRMKLQGCGEEIGDEGAP